MTGIQLNHAGHKASTSWRSVAHGHQVRFPEAIRKDIGIPVGAVGLITELGQARGIVSSEEADLVFLERQLLRGPYWPLRNAPAESRKAPVQYARAFI